jgi:hypothetical protein
MSLANIYLELHRQAQRTGQDRAIVLKGGAKLAVRVQDGVTTLTIARKGKKVGSTELETFKRECGVPAYASRWPADDQATRSDAEGFLWFFVAYRWAEGASN